MNASHRIADIADIAALEALYNAQPLPTATVKVTDHVHPLYAPFIEASPFLVLATCGPEGLDASPRGDAPGSLVAIEDAHTLLLPDRRGNNRLDSLRNIVRDPRVALLFFVPGLGETLRVNGRATVSADPALLARFAVDGKEPRSVIVIAVDEVYFQCQRALVRGRLWDAAGHVARESLPSIGSILTALSNASVDGEAYDRDLPGRVRTTLY